MKTTCLINNYNYRHFLGEAIDSALAQSVGFDEIIVVDDGSTDGSVPWLKSTYGGHPAVTIIDQTNQGQLSCFNRGFQQSAGEIVFFLDADDLYESNYVERVLRVYDAHPTSDFVFSGYQWYGERHFREPRPIPAGDLGYSVIAAHELRAWIGGPTSCLSMRRGILERLLPLPDTEQWRIRADDCLVFGSSLVGARKYHLAEPLVKYRLHGDNSFAGGRVDAGADYRRSLAIHRLFRHVTTQMGYDPQTLPQLAHREFRVLPAPTFRQLCDYMRLVLTSRMSVWMKTSLAGSVLGRYLRPRRRNGRQQGKAVTTVEKPRRVRRSSARRVA